MASSDSQIDKPQRGHPKRAELPDVNINTGAQSINTERASLTVYVNKHLSLNLILWILDRKAHFSVFVIFFLFFVILLHSQSIHLKNIVGTSYAASYEVYFGLYITTYNLII